MKFLDSAVKAARDEHTGAVTYEITARILADREVTDLRVVPREGKDGAQLICVYPIGVVHESDWRGSRDKFSRPLP